MADYLRFYAPGGLYFFIVVTERRAGILANDTARVGPISASVIGRMF